MPKNEASERLEFRKLLQELIEGTNRTLLSHAAGLKRHEEALLAHEKDLSVALQSLATHASAIATIRTDLENLAPLINAQSTLLHALQGAVLRIISHLGMDPPELPPGAMN